MRLAAALDRTRALAAGRFAIDRSSALRPRRLLAPLVLLLLPALTPAAHAAEASRFPTRPVRIVVPFPPGAGTDIVGRAIAQSLHEAWKEPVIVENRPGAGGTIGSELVARATPDGHTLLLGNVSTLAIARSLYPKLAYDPLVDFEPIALATTSENVIVVHPSVPADSVQALIALARAKPGQLNYGSAGSGTSSHLGGAMFCTMAGVQMTHIPYKGSTLMMPDLLAGQVQVSFSSVPTALPHIQAGRLRAIAATRLERSTTLPQLPTVHESGVPGFDISLWQGIVAPRGTPREVIAKLNAQIVASLKAPALRQQLVARGLDPVGGTPAQFRDYIREEAAKWEKVVKASGARP